MITEKPSVAQAVARVIGADGRNAIALQILDYYSTTDKYIHSKLRPNAHQSVFTKENDKYQWLVLEQKSQCEVEVRQTDRHETITARDNYELTRNIPKCVGVERLCEGQIHRYPLMLMKSI